MKKPMFFDRILIRVYIALSVVIFFLIKWAENSQPYSITGKIMYSDIVLNFAAMLYFSVRNSELLRKKAGAWVVPAALSFTLIADYFLTLTDTHMAIGIFFFCIVQLIYGMKPGYHGWDVTLRLVIFALLFLLLGSFDMKDPVGLLGAADLALLSGNTAAAFACFRRSGRREDGLLALGLLLFLGCDISLTTRIVTSALEALPALNRLADFMIWVFYLYSQLLLTMAYILELSIKGKK